MELREIVWSGKDLIDLAQDRHQCRSLVSTVMKLVVPENVVKFLSSRTTCTFSRRLSVLELVG
jgi:hypothetical protein